MILYILSILLVLSAACNIWLLYRNSVQKKGSVTAPKRPKNEYFYLAIGNSITRHGKCSYWWDDRRGMASSALDKDYVHLVAAHLQKSHSRVAVQSFNFSAWEVLAHDRVETFTLLQPYLDAAPKLITLQLGENVSSIGTLQNDYAELLKHLQKAVPQSKIVAVGEFFPSAEKNEAKRLAAEACGIPFVDLSDIAGKTEYCSAIGTKVLDDQGGEHAVDHGGVAKHPGDAGMALIADRIIQQL